MLWCYDFIMWMKVAMYGLGLYTCTCMIHIALDCRWRILSHPASHLGISVEIIYPESSPYTEHATITNDRYYPLSLTEFRSTEAYIDRSKERYLVVNQRSNGLCADTS